MTARKKQTKASIKTTTSVRVSEEEKDRFRKIGSRIGSEAWTTTYNMCAHIGADAMEEMLGEEPNTNYLVEFHKIPKGKAKVSRRK